MGFVFRRTSVLCTTCRERLLTTAAKRRCEKAGHTLKERVSPIWWYAFKTKDGWQRHSSKSQAKIDAQRLLRDKEGAIDRGLHSGRLAIQDYRINKRRSLDVFERRVTKHLAPAFGGRGLADITTPIITAFIEQRQKAGASNAEINRELDALSKMFTIAIRNGQIFARPYVPKLKEAAPRKGFVTDTEYTAIRERLEPHMRGIWAFQFLTGWRSTEVLALRWEHVAGDEIRFTEQTKADEAARPFPITPAIKAVLDEQRKLTGHFKVPHVFCQTVGKKRGGRPISYMGYLHAFNDARGAAKTRPDLIPHDCRRTAIDRLERLGVARSTAMVLVGHKTESVYRRYAITSARTIEEAGKRLRGVRLPTQK
jgi:integrase